ncbi:MULTISPECIES: 4Fe-4S dicluster domain-containing protein [unclassified Nostoc]|uniref:4Fe-4S dicluster domain-containing protein n=1 Tax=unclassified Nostoc TaxID=2593658 RepID=UPI0025CCA51B|nr:ferredoxin family protein [Nostoc sp. NMS8]MBN3960908.1 ferredoxin family protein [Nostoc sp. NMS8]
MIELVSESRCIKCNICVSACPTNVFDKVPDGPPRIARKSDCQTCFMCELYCPVDALFVAPQADESVQVDEETLIKAGLLGGYRETLGWNPGGTPAGVREQSAKIFMGRNNLPSDPQGRILPWSNSSNSQSN